MEEWIEREFEGVSFEGAEWIGWVLRGCRFERCSFHGARLTELRTEQCRFEECDFTGAQLNGSTHQRTSFANSRLVYANLFLAVLTDCQMMGVDFTDADLI